MTKRTPPPLDRAALDRLALRYVERFATTQARLAAYLARKIRERGWEGPAADPAEIARRFADRGYVDDQAFAEAKARSMARRGFGARRVAEALRHAGVDPAARAATAADLAAGAVAAALTLARRRRIGPFAIDPAEPAQRQRQLAALIRAGHDPALARRIVAMQPGDDAASLLID